MLYNMLLVYKVSTQMVQCSFTRMSRHLCEKQVSEHGMKLRVRLLLAAHKWLLHIQRLHDRPWSIELYRSHKIIFFFPLQSIFAIVFLPSFQLASICPV